MRKVLISVFLTGIVYSLFATDARVQTMGRSDLFFMDDISIYRNPANLSIYPNMLLGEMGIYVEDPTLDDTSNLSGLNRHNRDPQKPYFGGILSYSLNQSADAGDQYPMVSLGLVFNRYDRMLHYILPESNDFIGIIDTNVIKIYSDTIVGKVDIITGYALKNGIMLGLGGYFAFHKEKNKNQDNTEAKIVKATVGINFPIAKTMDLEVSVNGGALTKVAKVDIKDPIDSTSITKNVSFTIAKNDIFLTGDVRLFSALSSLNGDFVPHFGLEYIQYNSNSNKILGFNAGLAININIDRGFFWAGIEGLYEDNDLKKIGSQFKKYEAIGGKVHFGIERNIIWDWFVWRIGCSKIVKFEKIGGANGITRWTENPEADGSDKDHVGFGLGLNIENRLKVDAVIAEDIFYTFTNLISGSHHHITSRISATYSF